MIKMRQEILKLKEIGKMPTETLDDDESIEVLIDKYDKLLTNIEKPISYEEGLILVDLFPEGFFYDLHWELLHLVESLVVEESKEKYLNLIKRCPSNEWREMLLVRFENWKGKN
jgi:hypothetical protein